MNETLQSKLARLLSDKNIYKVEINIKCKTHDGMIYTLMSQEYDRTEETKETTLPFAECIHSHTVQNLLEVMGIVEKDNGYWFSVEEMVAVKHTEITRIWAELGDLHIDTLPEPSGD
jgi:hypothetical protein